MKTLNIPFRQWQIKKDLDRLWIEYANTGSQRVYQKIRHKESDLRHLKRKAELR